MLFVAEILLLLLTVYLSCKVYLPKINVDEKPLILNQAEISKFVEEKLTWILKEDLAKDLMTLVDTVIMIVERQNENISLCLPSINTLKSQI